MRGHENIQWVPVKVYQSADRLTVAAPMPGMDAEDIAVEITPENQLVLHGNGRGTLKHENLVLGDEWNPGPYCREITLPATVDGSMANLTYRNGILVIALPLAAQTRPAHLKFGTRWQRLRRAHRERRPSSTPSNGCGTQRVSTASSEAPIEGTLRWDAQRRPKRE